MNNNLEALVKKCIGNHMEKYPEIAELYPYLSIKMDGNKVGRVDFFPTDEVKLSHQSKKALVKRFFYGKESKSRLSKVLSIIDLFDVEVVKNPFNGLPVVKVVHNIKNTTENKDVLNTVYFAQLGISNAIDWIGDALTFEAKMVAINVLDLESRHNTKTVLRSIKHGRCELQIIKKVCRFEAEDYYSKEWLISALDVIRTGNGEVFSLDFVVKWNGQNVHYLSMEGYITQDNENPLSVFKSGVCRLAKVAISNARVEVHKKSIFFNQGPEITDVERMFSGMKL